MKIDAKKIYSMRQGKVKMISNSFYVPAFHMHFIATISNIKSISKCMYYCQNDEYCRTAQYNSRTLTCSLYEEYSFVGTILPAIENGQSILSFSFCPSNAFDESIYVCNGSPSTPPILITNVIQELTVNTPSAQLSAYATASTWTTKILVFAPMWNWDKYVVRDVNDDYIQIAEGTLVPGIMITYIEVDNDDYYTIVNSLGILYIRSNSMNKTINSTRWRITCMSDIYIVAIPTSTTDKTFYVHWKSNGSIAFLLPAPLNGAAGCLIFNKHLFIVGRSSDPSIQSILLDSSQNASNYSVIIPTSECPEVYQPLKVDSSGRFFVICVNSSVPSMLIFTSNGTILGRVNHSIFGYSQTQFSLKATKYRYSINLRNSSITIISDF